MTTRSRYTAAITDKPWWLAGGIPQSACVAAYQAVGASDYASSKINLSNPGVNNAVNGALYPTWNATDGWIFDGSSFLTTPIITNIGMSWIVSIANGDTSAVDRCVFGGMRGGSPYDGIVFQNTLSVDAHQYTNGSYLKVSKRVGSGIFSAAGTNVYRDGLSEGALINSGDPDNTIYIGCSHYGATTIQNYVGNIIAIAFYSMVITHQQVLAVTNAMNAL